MAAGFGFDRKVERFDGNQVQASSEPASRDEGARRRSLNRVERLPPTTIFGGVPNQLKRRQRKVDGKHLIQKNPGIGINVRGLGGGGLAGAGWRPP